MNIRQAKQTVIDTVEAYLAKDETGSFLIPVPRQRPLLLIGPPGIGKTAIMEQVAEELGINLVSYTITHHTRQSAIGLPSISRKTYGGTEYQVTEYTMSEIIASVYDQIERTGIHEGILFLDEINCVSETLAPTMLQFLQYKTFGTHRVPDGFVIVTAGNPPEYNRSVRDLDIVTLDRVKRIDITADLGVWKEYARKAGVHGSILSYLGIRKEHFYSVKQDLDGARFVTARGWEDLSRIITVYEKLGKKADEALAAQYLEDPEIAADFAVYYELYCRYSRVFRIDGILDGTCTKGTEELARAPFDEKLSLIGLLTNRLDGEFRRYGEQKELQRALADILKRVIAGGSLKEERDKLEKRLAGGTAAGLIGENAARTGRRTVQALKELETVLAQPDAEPSGAVKAWFAAREQRRMEEIRRTGAHLTRAFAFLAETFGEGQEMVLFLTELSGGYDALRFISECGNEAYEKYNRLLLLRDRRRELDERLKTIDLSDEQQDSGCIFGKIRDDGAHRLDVE